MDPNNNNPNNPTPQPDLGSIPSNTPQSTDLSSTLPIPQAPVDLPASPTQTEPLSSAPTISDTNSFSVPIKLPDLSSAAQPPMSEPAPSTPLSNEPTQNEPTTSPTFTGGVTNDTSMPPPDTSFQTIPGAIPNQSNPTPTFTPPPIQTEPGQAENSTNPSDFNTPTSSFNWSDNQNSSSGTSSNDSFNFSNPTGSNPAEPAPSDLSHLVNASDLMNPTGQESVAPLAQPETLIPGAATAADTPNIPTEESHKSFPKWIIGVGVGLLLAVAGASAYFILGIGKSQLSESIPAAENNPQATIAPPVIQPTLIPTIAIPTATPSGTSLPGGSGTQATSAADLLRQRQGK